LRGQTGAKVEGATWGGSGHDPHEFMGVWVHFFQRLGPTLRDGQEQSGQDKRSDQSVA